MIHICRKS